MSQNNGRSKRSNKGLLTADNCVVALIDHQPQMLFGTSNFDRQSIINNCTVALSKASRVFDVPVVLTTVETKSFSGNLWPQIKETRRLCGTFGDDHTRTPKQRDYELVQ